jgi:flagellar assembly protein FliH
MQARSPSAVVAETNLSERQSRVIRGGGAWQPLQISKLGGSCARFAQPLPGAADDTEVEARVAAAFRDGLAEGQFRAQSEAQERERQQVLSAQQRWDGLLAGLTQGLREIESATADRLLDLTTLLAATIACREIALSADRIVPVLDQSLKLIAGSCRQLEVTAHPSDCAAIDTWLRPRCGETQLSVRADPDVAPGGCLLRADETTLDATLQTRIRRTLASVGITGVQAEAVVVQALEAGADAAPTAADEPGAVRDPSEAMTPDEGDEAEQ